MYRHNFVYGLVLASLSSHTLAFSSAEHKAIGDGLNLRFLSDPTDPHSETVERLAGDYPLIDVPDVGTITYGDLVAAPDYFGLPSDPLADSDDNDRDMETRAQGWFQSWYQIMDGKNEFGFGSKSYQNLIFNKIYPTEKEHAFQAIAEGKDPAINWPSWENELRLMTALRDWDASTYLTLEGHNIDHCQDHGDAKKAYRAMRLLALQTALEAGRNKQEDGLRMAYMMNAFADHFLSDQFASGHTRVPRRKLMDVLGPDCGGQWTLKEHDYENEVGLLLQNQNETWRARERSSSRRANATVAVSAQGVFDMYLGAMRGDPIDIDDPKWFEAWDYVPSSDLFQNFPPLFKVADDGTLLIRSSITDIYERNYVPMGDHSFLLCEMKMEWDGHKLKDREYKGDVCSDEIPCANGNKCSDSEYGTCGVTPDTSRRRRNVEDMGF
eukprot:Clim_evm17s218 gene=Clim_evmTU17s218